MTSSDCPVTVISSSSHGSVTRRITSTTSAGIAIYILAAIALSSPGSQAFTSPTYTTTNIHYVQPSLSLVQQSYEHSVFLIPFLQQQQQKQQQLVLATSTSLGMVGFLSRGDNNNGGKDNNDDEDDEDEDEVRMTHSTKYSIQKKLSVYTNFHFAFFLFFILFLSLSLSLPVTIG